jgi:hypothetical protein
MKIRTCIVALMGGVLAQGALAADTVQMRFTGTGLGKSVKISVNGGSQQGVFAGELLHEFANGVGRGATINGVKATFCTDLFQHVTSSWKTYELKDVAAMPVPAMGNARANAIADVYNFGVGAVSRGEMGNDMAAALQIAIWEVVTDFDIGVGRSTLNVTDGAFKAYNSNSNALPAIVSGYLNDIFNYIGEANNHNDLIGFANGTAQDQIIRIPTVPLPSGAGMAVAGLAALGLVRRRR